MEKQNKKNEADNQNTAPMSTWHKVGIFLLLLIVSAISGALCYGSFHFDKLPTLLSQPQTLSYVQSLIAIVITLYSIFVCEYVFKIKIRQLAAQYYCTAFMIFFTLGAVTFFNFMNTAYEQCMMEGWLSYYLLPLFIGMASGIIFLFKEFFQD